MLKAKGDNIMDDRYADVFSWELRDVVREFRQKYANHEGLNGQKMRGVLKGDLIIVPIRGIRKFQLWSKQDILEGKLDKLNAKIKHVNATIRRLQKVRKEEFYRAFNEMRGEVDVTLIAQCLEKIIVQHRRGA